jgi:hypothetical protein
VSGPGDRVAVPTNGHRPALVDPDANTDLAESTDLESGTPTFGSPRRRGTTVPPVSPGQLAAGFGIIAALILLVLGRRRGRRG